MTEENVFNDTEIDIKEVLYVIKRKIWLIIIFIAVFANMGFFYSVLNYKPVYTAKASMVVNSKQIKILDGKAQLTNDIYLSEKMVNTYHVILLSDRLLNMINKDLDKQYSLDEMRSWINISSPKDTEVITVTVKNNNPQLAANIANEIMKYAPKVISETVEVGSINVVDYAPVPNVAEIPKTKLNIAIGGILGLFLGVLVVLTIEFMFPKVKNKDDICSKLGFQIFAEIPNIKLAKSEISSKFFLINENIDIKFKEAFNILDLRMKYLEKHKNIKKILVTSALEKEGKTTVSINLAMLLAKEGKKVLFLESDMYRPNIIKKLKKEKKEKKTFKDLLQEAVSIDDCIIKHKKLGVDIIAAGQIEENTSNLFNTSKLKKIFKILEEKYDYIVIDTPPAYILSDAITLSTYSDAIFMVVRQEHANINIIKETKQNFKNIGIEIEGAILNDIRYSSGDNKYKYKYKYKYNNKK